MNSIGYPDYQYCHLGNIIPKGKGKRSKMYDKFMHERILNFLLERRGGISFDRADKTALYVRMLGDVIVHGRLVTTDPVPIRRGSVPENEYKTPEILPSNQIRRTSLQTPTVAAIIPTATILSASQAKQTKDNDESDDTPKSPKAEQGTPSTVLMDSVYHTQAQEMLKNVGHWDFNIFKFDELSNGRSLRLVLYHLFQEHDLIRHFKLDSYRLLRSFEMIEQAYYSKSKNPYHNSMHAADVCQAMHCYLQEQKLRQALTPLEVMGALFGSAMHDLDHPGVNQKFLVNSKHFLADLYQNSSVLENHHWRVGISLLQDTGLLDHLPGDQWKVVADHIRSLILATDIARQQEFLSEFQRLLDGTNLNLNTYESRKLVLQIALKCADICNPCRTWQVTERWGNVVSEEFFRQGDREKKDNIPVSMNCDRVTTTIPQIQCGFIDFVVDPLFQRWDRFVPSDLSKAMLRNMKENRKLWGEKREQEQKKAEEEKSSTNQNSAIQSRSNEEDTQCKPADNAKSEEKTDSVSARNSVEIAEPESKSMKLSKANDGTRNGEESVSIPQADSHKASAIRDVNRVVRVDRNPEQTRPHSAVLSPKTHRVHGLHRTIDATLSDSTAMSAHSQSADNLRSSGSFSMLPSHLASGAKQRGQGSPKMSKRAKNASDNMLQGGYVGSKRLDSFSLRLPRSPNTLRKNVSFEDPWEKNENSPRSRTPDYGSLGGSPTGCIESPLLQRANHPLKYSHTDGNLRKGDKHSSNAIPKLSTGLNNNLDFTVPVDIKSPPYLHHNMSHNKHPESSELTDWSERALHLYPEKNNVLQRNSTHFLKPALSPGSHDFSGSPKEQKPVATPPSLLVKKDSSRKSKSLSPPSSQHLKGKGYSSSLPHPGRGRDSKREMGSPFIQKKMQDRDDRIALDVPAILSTGSLSPRVPPRTVTNLFSPTSPPPTGLTPNSPPFTVPTALQPLLQDFASTQFESISRRNKLHMKEGDPPQPHAATSPPGVGDRSPRVNRGHLGGSSRREEKERGARGSQRRNVTLPPQQQQPQQEGSDLSR